jgi:RND family efflux transporter MFP subunit
MKTAVVLLVLAVLGLAVGLIEALRPTSPAAQPQSVATMPPTPFTSFVVGTGLVEANTENIAVGTNVGGVVASVAVAPGTEVKKGDALFAIDDREARAALTRARAGVQVAEAQLALAQAMDQRTQRLEAQTISDEAVQQRHFARLTAEAALAQAQAQAQAADTQLQLLTVRAPIDGQVLQLKVHVGEFAPTGVLSQPLVLMGNVDPLQLRVEVDEHDAARIKDGAAAVGFLRQDPHIRTQLEFVRFEPYVVPKVSLTGATSERVDTRVLQIIYRFRRATLPIFVGQQMDACIKAER